MAGFVIWRITGNEVGPDDSGADYFWNYEEALAAFLERGAQELEKLYIPNKKAMVFYLRDAMGYGGS